MNNAIKTLHKKNKQTQHYNVKMHEKYVRRFGLQYLVKHYMRLKPGM
jgi:hypothetical protein